MRKFGYFVITAMISMFVAGSFFILMNDNKISKFDFRNSKAKISSPRPPSDSPLDSRAISSKIAHEVVDYVVSKNKGDALVADKVRNLSPKAAAEVSSALAEFRIDERIKKEANTEILRWVASKDSLSALAFMSILIDSLPPDSKILPHRFMLLESCSKDAVQLSKWILEHPDYISDPLDRRDFCRDLISVSSGESLDKAIEVGNILNIQKYEVILEASGNLQNLEDKSTVLDSWSKVDVDAEDVGMSEEYVDKWKMEIIRRLGKNLNSFQFEKVSEWLKRTKLSGAQMAILLSASNPPAPDMLPKWDEWMKNNLSAEFKTKIKQSWQDQSSPR